MGSMASTKLEVPPDQSVGARYESLIRLADSIRSQPEPKALFHVLVNELSQVIPFDAIALRDESLEKVTPSIFGRRSAPRNAWSFCWTSPTA